MTTHLTTCLALIHFISVGSIALYGIHRLWLLVSWYRIRRNAPRTMAKPVPASTPHVTIQLPLYNEKYVVRQLIHAVAQIDWPAHRLEIQVLDDSTDETSDVVDTVVGELSQTGTAIRTIRRKARTGYKAGALQNGLRQAEGEFIAVFDADFIPAPDFLKETMPFFSSPETGMVQVRWRFANQDHSWLTRIQALLLGPHFDIEHRVRFSRGLFFNFNGTAGIWRKEAILSAGGWEHDTVTEDLDLSYRAQLKGWKFVYLHHYGVQSELPVTISAFRRQQQRWAMGSVQTARKILPQVLKSELPPAVKGEALFHLLSNLGWFSGALATLTLYPALKWRFAIDAGLIPWMDIPLFTGAACAIPLYFFLHSKAIGEKGLLGHAALIPVFSIGFAPGPAAAVLKGVVKGGGKFERTPKYGAGERGRDTVRKKAYHRKSLKGLTVTSLLLAWSLMPPALAVTKGAWLVLPFLLIFPAGFALVLAEEIQEFRK